MLDVMPFLMRFVISYGDSFRYFEHHEAEILRLPLPEKNFLLDAGLPKSAEPGLHFLEVEEIPNTPYVKIGEDWQKNSICIDTGNAGLVVLVNEKDVANVRWFNKSILVMCEVLFHYMNFLMKAGKKPVQDNQIPDSLIEQFEARIRRLDPDAVERNGAFWSAQIRWLKSHHKPNGFNPWRWIT
ncbi:MAG: SUKH-4 family immunity protein [Desulfomonilaceae bacterium]